VATDQSRGRGSPATQAVGPPSEGKIHVHGQGSKSEARWVHRLAVPLQAELPPEEVEPPLLPQFYPIPRPEEIPVLEG
jgi:hypothetical protein